MAVPHMTKQQFLDDMRKIALAQQHKVGHATMAYHGSLALFVVASFVLTVAYIALAVWIVRRYKQDPIHVEPNAALGFVVFVGSFLIAQFVLPNIMMITQAIFAGGDFSSDAVTYYQGLYCAFSSPAASGNVQAAGFGQVTTVLWYVLGVVNVYGLFTRGVRNLKRMGLA